MSHSLCRSLIHYTHLSPRLSSCTLPQSRHQALAAVIVEDFTSSTRQRKAQLNQRSSLFDFPQSDTLNSLNSTAFTRFWLHFPASTTPRPKHRSPAKSGGREITTAIMATATAATTEAPYGAWKSPLTADLVSGLSLRYGSAAVDSKGLLLWVNSRPAENGRNVIARESEETGGAPVDVTPSDSNVRTMVQEYGGGEWILHGDVVYYSNFDDQRVYALSLSGGAPRPISPAQEGKKLRYAAGVIDTARNRFISVREDHRVAGAEPVNDIVALPLDSANPDTAEAEVLVSGNDFYAYPTLSPDGSQLAWVEWSHPNMPWDKTQLWLGTFDSNGTIGSKVCVAGGDPQFVEAPLEPQWSPAGELYFITDRGNGFWNLHRWVVQPEKPEAGTVEALYPVSAEFSGPLWVQKTSRTYAFVPGTSPAGSHIVIKFCEHGLSKLGLFDVSAKTMTAIPSTLTTLESVFAGKDQVFVLGGSATQFPGIVEVELNDELTGGKAEKLRWSLSGLDLEPYKRYLSIPKGIEFPTKEPGKSAYAIFYPPSNSDFSAPPNSKPPLLVKSHGGPTASASSDLNMKIQYWTSRGWAVADVNYGGSTGYGREYRERLNKNWGIVDVDDCCSCAEFLVREGIVDGERLAIEGGSAGGYTTLAVLTFRDTFKAGASFYGIGDLKSLAGDTHKFESRYLDQLLGPYDTCAQLYHDRSPINFTDRLSCPIILFQGLEDKVVPPNQAREMYEAVKAKGIPVALVEYEGEDHGFRKAENVKNTLEQQYLFFARVLGGFSPADTINPVHIDNLD